MDMRQHMVIGADINLGGSYKALERMASNIYADRTDLKPARTLTLGDNSVYTWTHNHDTG